MPSHCELFFFDDNDNHPHGRASCFKKIETAFASSNNKKVIVNLYGESGNGKTELSIDYQLKFSEKHPFVFRINLSNGLTNELARAYSKSNEIETHTSVLLKFLDALFQSQNSLFIFDGIEKISSESYDELLTRIANAKKGKFLLLSQNKIIIKDVEILSIYLGKFGNEEAKRFILSKLPSVNNHHASLLLDAVGNSPVFLNFALLHILNVHCADPQNCISSFLELMEVTRPENNLDSNRQDNLDLIVKKLLDSAITDKLSHMLIVFTLCLEMESISLRFLAKAAEIDWSNDSLQSLTKLAFYNQGENATIRCHDELRYRMRKCLFSKSNHDELISSIKNIDVFSKFLIDKKRGFGNYDYYAPETFKNALFLKSYVEGFLKFTKQNQHLVIKSTILKRNIINLKIALMRFSMCYSYDSKLVIKYYKILIPEKDSITEDNIKEYLNMASYGYFYRFQKTGNPSHLNKALKLNSESLNVGDSNTEQSAFALSVKGLIAKKNKDYDTALACFTTAKEIREAIKSNSASKLPLAISHSNLAKVYLLRDDSEKVVESFKQCIGYYKSILRENKVYIPTYSLTLFAYASYMEEKTENASAKQLFKKALKNERLYYSSGKAEVLTFLQRRINALSGEDIANQSQCKGQSENNTKDDSNHGLYTPLAIHIKNL